MNDLIRQARDNANRVGGLLDVSVPLGLPPIGTVNLGKLTFTGDCTTDPTIAFSRRRDHDVQRFLRRHRADRQRLDRPRVLHRRTGHPSARTRSGHCHAGTAASPLCVSIDPSEWTASRPTVADPEPSRRQRPASQRHPARRHPIRTSSGCRPSRAPRGISPISGSIDWPGAFPGISLGDVVPKRTSVRFDCGFIEVTSTASTPWGDLALRGLARRDGSFEAAVVTKGMRLFGKTTNTDLTGTFARSATGRSLVGRRRHHRAVARDRRHHPADVARRARAHRASVSRLPVSCTSVGAGPVGRRHARPARSPVRTSSLRR